MHWETFFNAIFSSKKDSIADPTALEYINSLENIENEGNINSIISILRFIIIIYKYIFLDGKFCIQFSLLSYLVPPTGRTRVSQKVWKYTTIEAKEGLIVHVKVNIHFINLNVEGLE